MLGEVIATAICTANALNPPVRGEAFGIPAVASVVRHLILHVLSEATPIWLYTHHIEEEEDTSHEVAQRLICDYTLSQRKKNLIDDPIAGVCLSDCLRASMALNEKATLPILDFLRTSYLFSQEGVRND